MRALDSAHARRFATPRANRRAKFVFQPSYPRFRSRVGRPSPPSPSSSPANDLIRPLQAAAIQRSFKRLRVHESEKAAALCAPLFLRINRVENKNGGNVKSRSSNGEGGRWRLAASRTIRVRGTLFSTPGRLIAP